MKRTPHFWPILNSNSNRQQVVLPAAVAQVNWSCLVQSNGDKNSSRNAAATNVFGTLLQSIAYLDFTVAPGQCTWLSVSTGKLWGYLILPTKVNWKIYREWKNDAKFATIFLAKRVDKCIKCVVCCLCRLVGYLFAILAAKTRSLFYSCFAWTSAMETKLGVVLLEMQHNALAQY